jgi:ribonuclease VapC
MVAIDTSALVAMALSEPEGAEFEAMIARSGGALGTPTLLELHQVLSRRLGDGGAVFIGKLLATPIFRIVPFDLAMARHAREAFDRFGKGGGHPAGLNFGDCLSYGVARALRLPLLFKGVDFLHTDVEPAYRAGA